MEVKRITRMITSTNGARMLWGIIVAGTWSSFRRVINGICKMLENMRWTVTPRSAQMQHDDNTSPMGGSSGKYNAAHAFSEVVKLSPRHVERWSLHVLAIVMNHKFFDDNACSVNSLIVLVL